MKEFFNSMGKSIENLFKLKKLSFGFKIGMIVLTGTLLLLMILSITSTHGTYIYNAGTSNSYVTTPAFEAKTAFTQNASGAWELSAGKATFGTAIPFTADQIKHNEGLTAAYNADLAAAVTHNSNVINSGGDLAGAMTPIPVAPKLLTQTYTLSASDIIENNKNIAWNLKLSNAAADVAIANKTIGLTNATLVNNFATRSGVIGGILWGDESLLKVGIFFAGISFVGSIFHATRWFKGEFANFFSSCLIAVSLILAFALSSNTATLTLALVTLFFSGYSIAESSLVTFKKLAIA